MERHNSVLSIFDFTLKVICSFSTINRHHELSVAPFTVFLIFRILLVKYTGVHFLSYFQFITPRKNMVTHYLREITFIKTS
jgi:hypothetical protein